MDIFWDLDTQGQKNIARVREIAVIVAIEVTVKMRLQRGDKRNQVVAQERSEHNFGDLVDIWTHLNQIHRVGEGLPKSHRSMIAKMKSQ